MALAQPPVKNNPGEKRTGFPGSESTLPSAISAEIPRPEPAA